MSKYLPIFITAAIILAIDFYAYQGIRYAISSSSLTIRKVVMLLYWAISVFTISSIFLFTFYSPFNLPQSVRVIWFGSLIIFYLPKILLIPFLLVDDTGRMVRWVANLITVPKTVTGGRSVSRSDFLIQSGLIISGLFFSGLVYGVFRGGYNYQVVGSH